MTRLEKAKAWWRPVMAWCFIAGWVATLGTIIALMWLDRVTLSDASGLLIALVAGGAAPTTTYTYGRTTEKRDRVAEDYPPPENFQQGN